MCQLCCGMKYLVVVFCSDVGLEPKLITLSTLITLFALITLFTLITFLGQLLF